MTKFFQVLTAVIALCVAVNAQLIPLQSGELVITEIMYNPDSSETSPHPAEWLEVTNPGGAPVDMTGFFLQDEDGQTGPVPAGTMVGAGESVVIIPDTIGIAEFQAAWGTGFQVLPVASWTSMGLSNSPSLTNELMGLFHPLGGPVDLVNYDDTSPWPSDSPDGPSIYLPCGLAPSAFINDNGANWRRSQDGLDGAFINTATTEFNGIDIGSPGTVFASSIVATSVLLGGGCGAPTPTLTVTPPVPGETVAFDLQSAFPSAHTFLFLSIGTPTPFVDPVSGCTIFVDILNLSNLHPFWEGFTDAAGNAGLTVPLGPAWQAGLGLDFTFQGRVWSPGGPLNGDHVSNGVLVTIGCPTLTP